jgi:hypothetical protein
MTKTNVERGAMMTKPKPKPKPAARARGPIDPEIRVLGVRATRAWCDWLERAAKHGRVTVAAFVDRATAEHAKASGFDEPPPERLP